MIVIPGHSLWPNGPWDEFKAWCAANGFDSHDITGHVVAVNDAAQTITVRLFDRNQNGDLFKDATGERVSSRGHLLPLVEPLPPPLLDFALRFPPEPEWPCPTCGTATRAGEMGVARAEGYVSA